MNLKSVINKPSINSMTPLIWAIREKSDISILKLHADMFGTEDDKKYVKEREDIFYRDLKELCEKLENKL